MVAHASSAYMPCSCKLRSSKSKFWLPASSTLTRLHDALSGHASNNVEEAVRFSLHRLSIAGACTGVCLEECITCASMSVLGYPSLLLACQGTLLKCTRPFWLALHFSSCPFCAGSGHASVEHAVGKSMQLAAN
eukprot:1161000-Pelagomonas_calceolata.AAC.8